MRAPSRTVSRSGSPASTRWGPISTPSPPTARSPPRAFPVPESRSRSGGRRRRVAGGARRGPSGWRRPAGRAGGEADGDGALGSAPAALHAPYCDDPANRGSPAAGRRARARARAAAARGFRSASTRSATGPTLTSRRRSRPCSGGGPNSSGAASGGLPVADPRHRVEHAQILAEADIPAFAPWRLPSMQPTHCTSDMPGRTRDSARSGFRGPTPGARAPHGDADRRRLGLPRRATEPVSRDPRRRHAARGRPGSRLAAEQRMTRAEAVRPSPCGTPTPRTRKTGRERWSRGSGPTGRRSAVSFACAEAEIAAITPG